MWPQNLGKSLNEERLLRDNINNIHATRKHMNIVPNENRNRIHGRAVCHILAIIVQFHTHF